MTLNYTGEYTCTAENEGGEISDMINVNVYGKECVYLKLALICLYSVNDITLSLNKMMSIIVMYVLIEL